MWRATETKKILPSVRESSNQFGFSVSISGGTVIVGTPRDDDNGSRSGSAYIFEKGAGGWPATETKRITALDFANSLQFGNSVSISGDTVIVGSFSGSSVTAYIFE